MRRNKLWLAGLMVVLTISPAIGQEKPAEALSRAELDKRIATLVYETVKEGVDLYNAGKQESCLSLYQGSLMVLQGILDHRPKTVAAIKDALATAKTQRVGEAAFTLRKVLDETQAEVTGKAKLPDAKAAVPAKKPLWDRLGGATDVQAVVKDFVAAAAADPKVNFSRDGKYKLDADAVEKLEKLLVEMISENTDGPLKYTGRSMKEVHKGMKITEAEFNALAGHLVATLKKYKVPQMEIDELIAIVGTTKADIVEVK